MYGKIISSLVIVSFLNLLCFYSPKVLTYKEYSSLNNPMDDIVLTEGMALAVEPMINAGSCAVRTLKNGWTVVTRDGKSSAHFEHTIVIVADGCEVMTVV